jgi:hypothetical protein
VHVSVRRPTINPVPNTAQTLSIRTMFVWCIVCSASSCSSSLIPTPPPAPSPPQFPLKHTQPPGKQPLLSCEACRLKNQCPSKRRTNPPTAAPSLSRGMWVAHSCRSMEKLGRESHKGGPMVWEARLVCHEPNPQQMSWFHFCLSSFASY